MANLTIRNLEEARAILRCALAEEAKARASLGRAIHQRFKALGGVALQLPAREPIREVPKLGK
jgi:antitoxin FitA